MKPRIPSICRTIFFSLLLILIPYALAPYAGTALGYLGNAAEALACPVKSVSITPSNQPIEPGGSTSYQVTVSLYPEFKFKGLIVVSLTGLPSGVSCPAIEISDSDGDLTAVGTLSVSTTCSVTPGSYSLRLDAFARYPNPDSHDQYNGHPTVTLTVNTPSPCFSVDAHERKTVKAGEDTFFTTVVKWCGGYTGDVALSVDPEGLPAGVTWDFDDNPASPGGNACNGNAETKLHIYTSCDTPAGEYTLRVRGTSGDATDSDTVTLTVTEGGDFSLSGGSQSPSGIEPGESAEYTITGGFTGCFDGPVTLSAEGLPSDASASFDPESINAKVDSSTLTIRTGSATPAGTYTITIVGLGGDLRRETTVTLEVSKPSEFTLSASPTSREIQRGETAIYTITVNDGGPLPPYTVSFPDPSATDGMTATISPPSLPPTSSTNSVTLTVRTDETVQEGIYTITVTAGGGGHTEDVAVTLSVAEKPVLESAGLTVYTSVSPQSTKVGGLLLFTVEITNTGRGTLSDVVVRDNLPVGIGYVSGSAVADGRSLADPANKKNLLFTLPDIPGGDSVTLRFKAVVTPGISRGRTTNTVVVTGTDATGRDLMARASADVGVNAESMERKGKIKGKVFLDDNKNGLKNVDEEGIAGISVILETGERTTTDDEGAFAFDEIDAGEHLVGIDLRKLPREYFAVGDASKEVSLFGGGTGRAYFAVGRVGPSKKELEEMRKAEEERTIKEEEARKEEELKKQKEEEEKRAPKGTILGNVFVDDNDNGIYNIGEKRLEKVTVLLDSTKRAVTDRTGNFSFENVKVGRHVLTIREDQEFKKKYRFVKKEKITVDVKASTKNRKDIPVSDKGKLKINIEITVR